LPAVNQNNSDLDWRPWQEKRVKQASIENCGVNEPTLAAKPHPVLSSKLSVEHKRKLVAFLTADLLAAGYRTDLWICRRVAEVVHKKFRGTYQADHVGRILHDLGFSPQKPQRIHRATSVDGAIRFRRAMRS
jgi:hypothetical protein